jgi:hypothetical protein
MKRIYNAALKEFVVWFTTTGLLTSVFNNVVAANPPKLALISLVAANQHLLLLPIGIKTNPFLLQNNRSPSNVVGYHPTE